ncbi:fluoride efflux transporter CrcB [Desulfuromonas thiophila]|jgi:CrcB protein|uniref:Fluoride-specific ion channel FluC n=1 Tax=Desulfuromonas thiophila TaxID=57664 RepID=A0A1G6Z6C2_9BACT|nr:fluoride efflux transporter CrcB [Desulfuromonas thiophila]MCK9172842.1 fluoride efflux transporter CrcB [Desulfuromonas thiophila]MDD3802605.1 fluoride efflux transporter CrcB [Desulfuromonas thiophila]MDY0398980.1 fluoride efflux transporter CrcB [Desulfuromonas thiophila]SDD97517.1 camphor resistance protein CrcB [Desulfuromonas thiophila]
MTKWLAVALGGGCGCLCRYWLSGWVYAWLGRGLPYGTLAVNLLGSFLLGLLMELALRTTLIGEIGRLALCIGFMGGFTTFSTFSFETWRLLEAGQWLGAGLNVVLNVVLCLVGTGLGIALARSL